MIDRDRYIIPDDTDPPDTICLQIEIPSDIQWQRSFLGALRTLALWSNWERDEDKSGTLVAQRWAQAVNTLKECEPGWVGGGGPMLPDCVTIVDENTIDVRNCCMTPVTINVYDCCCGDTGNDAVSGGDVPSMTGGPLLVQPGETNTTTPCDGAATIVPYVLSQINEFWQSVDNAINAGATVVEAITDVIAVGGTVFQLPDGVVETLSNAWTLSASVIMDLTNDTDFQLLAQIAWVKWFGGSGEVTQGKITRSDLQAWAVRNQIFYVSGGQTLWVQSFLYAMSFILNISKINARLALAQGTGSDTLCNFLYAEAGVQQPALPPPPGSAINPNAIFEASGLRFIKILGSQLMPPEPAPPLIQTDKFYALFLVYNRPGNVSQTWIGFMGDSTYNGASITGVTQWQPWSENGTSTETTIIGVGEATCLDHAYAAQRPDFFGPISSGMSVDWKHRDVGSNFPSTMSAQADIQANGYGSVAEMHGLFLVELIV